MRWLIAPLIALPLLLMACDSDDNGDTSIEPDTNGAASPPAAGTPPDEMTPTRQPGSANGDDNEVPDSIEELRALIASAAGDLDPNMIENVEHDDDALTITLKEEQELPNAESTCNDLSETLGFLDLTVVIESADGSQLAECSLSS